MPRNSLDPISLPSCQKHRFIPKKHEFLEQDTGFVAVQLQSAVCIGRSKNRVRNPEVNMGFSQLKLTLAQACRSRSDSSGVIAFGHGCCNWRKM